MLQVTFRNLLPSEALVREANDVYLALRDRANARSHRLRCHHVTISAEGATDERTDWVSCAAGGVALQKLHFLYGRVWNWSVKKTILDKEVYNDAGEKIGNVEALIIAPDKRHRT
jgi:hypothetical protein